MGPSHIPVLLNEVIEYLNCRPGGCYLDGTVGEGGHAEAILEASAPSGRLLAIDRDEQAIIQAQRRLSRFGERLILVQGDFKQLKEILNRQGIDKLDGVLLDLGLSSSQIEDAGRGFSFQSEGPLDMRQDQRQARTAADVVNKLSEAELARLIGEYGEERWSGRIARAIVRARQRGAIESTRQLERIISQAIPRAHHPRRIHPATRTFQALRIEVNRELEGLAAAIRDAVEALAVDGRVCVISYHSLEDRIVKRAFRRMSGQCSCPPELPQCVCGRQAVLRVITPKPVVPTAGEQKLNPRSRSAKLRVGQRLPLAA
jgi:16S rRNA (cytosine1402-N4)-methyltransferase